MKVLIVGLGNIGLGLIAPVFKNAGYDVVGTDAFKKRLDALEKGYFIQTPSEISKMSINVFDMNEIPNYFDLIVVSVGRNNLAKVAEWYKEKNFLMPVMLAENLPEPVNLFPAQISIVVDRICSRIGVLENFLSVTAEDYYKLMTLENGLTGLLKSDKNVELFGSEEEVELKRKQKLFTVNTSHVVAALYGKKLGCLWIEEAVKLPEVVEKMHLSLIEVGQ